MSGAQPKAAEIARAVGIIAEVDFSRIKTRLDQGWVSEWSDDLGKVFETAKEDRKSTRLNSSHLV